MRFERHMMLDIETMDSGPQSAVINIGARMFTNTGPSKGFEVFIDPARATKIGTVSDGTMKWWARQDAREQVFSGKMDPTEAAHRLIEFAKEQRAETVWANSPSFDIVILRHMFSQVNMDFPFAYKQERDYRTMRELGTSLGIDLDDLFNNPAWRGHVALDDATGQAAVTARILDYLFSTRAGRSDLGSDLHPAVPEPTGVSDASTALGSAQ